MPRSSLKAELFIDDMTFNLLPSADQMADHSRSGFKNAPVASISFKKDLVLVIWNCLSFILCRNPSCREKGIKFDDSESSCVEDALENEDFMEDFKELVRLA